MAKIKELKITNEPYAARNITECLAELNVYMHNKTKRVRLQTFGSNTRQEKGKQSQVLHIEQDIAEQLIEALQTAFNLKK